MFTEVICILIVCDGCGKPGFDTGEGGDYDAVAHFDTPEEAAEFAQREADWLIVGGRATCRRCAEKAACDLTGHDWGGWHPCGPHKLTAGGVYEGRSRHCQTCGQSDYDPPIPRPEETANAN